MLCAQKGRILHSGVHMVEGSFPQHHTCPCSVRAWEEDLPVSHSEQLTPAVGQCAACGLSCTSPEQPAWGGWVWCPLPVPPPITGEGPVSQQNTVGVQQPGCWAELTLRKILFRLANWENLAGMLCAATNMEKTSLCSAEWPGQSIPGSGCVVVRTFLIKPLIGFHVFHINQSPPSSARQNF